MHAEMAMMKSYALNQPDGKGGANRFVAYMVPKEPPKEQPAHPSNRSALCCFLAADAITDMHLLLLFHAPIACFGNTCFAAAKLCPSLEFTYFCCSLVSIAIPTQHAAHQWALHVMPANVAHPPILSGWTFGYV